MSIKALAMRLVEANRTNNIDDLLANDYAADVVSVEALALNPNFGAEVQGLDGLKAKHAWWEENMESHSVSCDGPYIHGDDRFSVVFEADATDKNSGQRNAMKEVAVYHVKDGKIAREEFFFDSAAFV